MKMNSLSVTFLLGTILLIASCSETNNETAQKAPDRQTHDFVNPIEKAHKMSKWNKKGVMKTNIDLKLGGTSLDAELFVETDGPGILLELSEDTVAIFTGDEMYAMPSDSAVSPFTLKTWAYFLEAPYKLNDPGTMMKKHDTAQMKGKTYDRAKLTFQSGTGDTPDDWYVLYRDQDSNQLKAMSYIVTAGRSVEEANKNPHAISYESFQSIEGVPVATTWKFWGWSEEKGFSEEPIGEATLSNIEFLEAGTLFEAAEGANKMKR